MDAVDELMIWNGRIGKAKSGGWLCWMGKIVFGGWLLGGNMHDARVYLEE